MTKRDMQSGVIEVEVDDAIATLTFNRPDKRNAINEPLISSLEAFFFDPPKTSMR